MKWETVNVLWDILDVLAMEFPDLIAIRQSEMGVKKDYTYENLNEQVGHSAASQCASKNFLGRGGFGPWYQRYAGIPK